MRLKSTVLAFILGTSFVNICKAGPVCDRVASVARYIVMSREANVGIVASWSAIGDELRYKLSEEDFKPAYQEMKKTVALIYLHPEEFTEENASEMILNNCQGDL